MKQPRCRCGHKGPTHDKTGCLIPYCRCRAFNAVPQVSPEQLKLNLAREKEIAAQMLKEQIERELDEAYAKASGF